SVRPNACLRCGIRMSFRLTPNAHRKKRLMISTSGQRNCAVVSAALTARLEVLEVMIVSRQCSIEVDVSAIDEDVLSRRVRGAMAEQKQHSPGNLLSVCHPF